MGHDEGIVLLQLGSISCIERVAHATVNVPPCALVHNINIPRLFLKQPSMARYAPTGNLMPKFVEYLFNVAYDADMKIQIEESHLASQLHAILMRED